MSELTPLEILTDKVALLSKQNEALKKALTFIANSEPEFPSVINIADETCPRCEELIEFAWNTLVEVENK